MLAAMPGLPPHAQAQHNINAPTINEDRLCAGCNKSVSSDTGGMVVAFGSSLWHVDCFKCAKCGNQVNADTNLLLLSDGSPVCANCYNCKVCKKPILDEAVMTGDDSFHAECFTCRSCKNRIDELVFAKTSQGFYCMKCHNERVARSRRHLAKQKQRERDRERAALGSSGGRNGTSTAAEGASSSNSASRPKEGELANGAPAHSDISRARDKRASGDSHGQPSQPGSRPSQSSTDGVLGSSHADGEHRPTSPAPPALSVTVAGPSSAMDAQEVSSNSRERVNSQSQENQRNGGVTDRRPSIDGPAPPPYSKTPSPANGNSDVESARSSASYGYNQSSTGPTSPSLSVSVSREGSVNDHGAPESSGSLPYLGAEGGGRNRSNSLTPRSRTGDAPGSGWPDALEQERRRKSHEDNQASLLQPTASGISGLHVAKKREKRNSVNPGLQLEASKMLQFSTAQRPSTSPSVSPASASPTGTGSALASAPAGTLGRSHSATVTATYGARESPRVTSPLKEYFVNTENNSPGSTAFYPPSSSARSVPSTARPSTAPNGAIGPSRKDVFGKFPQRSDSLQGADSPSASGVGSTPSSASRANGLPSSPYNGRLNAPPTLRAQRSFEERGGRLSPRKAEFGVDGTGTSGKRSRSVSPHPPDVPRSIESGTDTETDNGNDSDDILRNGQMRFPPALPPKDASTTELRARSASQSASQPNSAGLADGDDFLSEKGEHDYGPSMTTVTERTSGFFIAPALPPMRFSMSGTDFNELLSNIGSSASAKRLSMLPGVSAVQAEAKTDPISEEKIEDLDLDLDVANARTPTSLASTITPLMDMKPSSSDHVVGDTTMVIKPAERKASLRGRRAAPPEPIIMHPIGERGVDASSSSTVSPISSYHADGRRRSSRTDAAMKLLDEAGSPRSSTESRRPTTPKVIVNGVNGHGQGHRRSESNGVSARKQDATELVTRRLKEALTDATERSADYVKLDRAFVEAIVQSLEQRREQMTHLSTKLDGMKRTSQLMFDGLSVAQDEFKQQLEARQTAEEEVSRLKIEVSGQAARITVLSSEDRRREAQRQLGKELSENLSALEQELSKLKAERDMALAEVEELSASKSTSPNGDAQGANLGRSLTMRLDNIKRQYQHELIPLTQQREALAREIVDLKEARDIFLEETAVLNARNEELAQLNSQYERRLESHSREKSLPPVRPTVQSRPSFDSWKARQAQQAVAQAPPIVNATSTSSSATLIDEAEARQQKPTKPDLTETHAQRPRGIGLRWPGNKANRDATANGLTASDNTKGKKRVEHMFQQLSILRFARCDLCGDKMWGSQVRCSTCNLSVHVRCVGQVQASCTHESTGSDDHLAPVGSPPPSMFGRDLIEQVREDSKNSKNSELVVPIIVEKCIEAVEANAMDYEGIYRKTGGTGQSKTITALFERRDYEAFDLCDSDVFNDVSSVTSVLKNYFRSLPNPLLTFGMHEAFVAAGNIKDHQAKGQALKDLVKQLPAEHYHTLSCLMQHLHAVQLQADVNLMNARNLGVIFGPTLMRSADPSREFVDMAGKSFAIEYLIENAPAIFPQPSSSSS